MHNRCLCNACLHCPLSTVFFFFWGSGGLFFCPPHRRRLLPTVLKSACDTRCGGANREFGRFCPQNRRQSVLVVCLLHTCCIQEAPRVLHWCNPKGCRRADFLRRKPKAVGYPKRVIPDFGAELGGFPVGIKTRHHPNVKLAHGRNLKLPPAWTGADSKPRGFDEAKSTGGNVKFRFICLFLRGSKPGHKVTSNFRTGIAKDASEMFTSGCGRGIHGRANR